jgi:hypothetical protein
MSAERKFREAFLHSRKNDIVATPKCIVDDISRYLNIDFDPCPLNPEFDGLALDTRWGESNFVNPPFSDIVTWVRRGVASGKQCVFLVPARTSSQYWQRHVWPYADAMYFFTDRIQFEGYSDSFSTPMVLVLVNARNGRVPRIETLGHVQVMTMIPRRC